MTQATVRERRAVSVRGIIQGVGFRPFVYSLARRHALSGSVHNDGAGVHIEVEGDQENLDVFLRDLAAKPPPMAMVEAVTWERLPVQGDQDFRIEVSQASVTRQALISPDVATCTDCLWELFDPADRRYRYPFVNCTNCGPRFTITRSVPYDRAMTTMAGFPMCAACRQEYDDPADRRFHAQPNACPQCGPGVRLVGRQGDDLEDLDVDVVGQTAALLREGAVVAIKGLGGYHLACDPVNRDAVAALRARKVRQDKAFALMARDVEQVRAFCEVSPVEAELLTSAARPIVLLRRLAGGEIDQEVAPRQTTLGFMLAYTPLHHLLLRDVGIPLVMTSGNRSDEPIAFLDAEAFEQLGGIADCFLIHNRPIHMRCDDSVVRVVEAQPYPLRRSRGYAPRPLSVATAFHRHTLACGAELKNTFCVAKENHALLSHHIGDLENYETLQSFRDGIDHFCRLFDVRPQLVAYDLHPEYLSSKYGRELEDDGKLAVGIQHHHAHIAACLADSGRPDTEHVIGVAMDGTGYGTDGAIWGGEFFEGSIEEGFIRRAHLAYTALPGGAAAIREPGRMAIAHLLDLFPEEELLDHPLEVVRQSGHQKIRQIHQLVRSGINSPLTSSAGRLFDAVAAMLGVPGASRTTYEGQAAIELELVARGAWGPPYPFVLRQEGDGCIIETRDIIGGVVRDLLDGLSTGEIAARFHRTAADIVVAGCEEIRQRGGPTSVALSGGTFQNMLLLDQTVQGLREKGYSVYLHRRVPANDGGLSLGQAVLANSVSRQQMA